MCCRSHMTEPILIADLGGTNLRIAVSNGGVLDTPSALASGDFASLEDAIAAFLDGLDADRRPHRAVFAAAGPQDGETVTFTNREWRSPVAALQERFALSRLAVINDFAAVAHALPYLQPTEFRAIGAARDGRDAPMVVLGPGTGLGVAIVLPQSSGGHVVPGEGGHATLAAQNGREEQVIGYLRNLHGHVSAERALSGAGLADLHDAVRAVSGMPGRRLDAAAVTAEAESDPTCREAIALFTDFLATVAGDLALTAGAGGGVFIAGGIVPKFGALFDGDRFRRRFTTKGRLAGYLDPVPTRLITHSQPALLGLSRAAERILDTSV